MGRNRRRVGRHPITPLVRLRGRVLKRNVWSMRIVIFISLCVLALVASVVAAESEKSFQTIVVTDEQPAQRSIFLVDYNADFAWVAQHFGDHRDFGGNTKPGVFVHSHAHNRWLQILRVSTAGAKFGKSPDNAMIQAPWDFTSLAAKKFVPLPLPDAGKWTPLHLPDKVVYDAARNVFILYFDSSQNSDSMTSTLIISKSDLNEAFDAYYGRRR